MLADIPAEVDNYHNLFPLEPPLANPMQKSNTFGYPTTCYKAVNTKDGLTYCLRRVHGKEACLVLVIREVSRNSLMNDWVEMGEEQRRVFWGYYYRTFIFKENTVIGPYAF